METSKAKVLSGLIWKFAERISAQVVTFAVSVVLARLLTPEDYGLNTVVMIFITFTNCIVTNGVGSALIQKKDSDNLDFSTVLYFQTGLSMVLYLILFVSAPLFAKFFGQGYDLLVPVLRVLGIAIPLTAVNNVQQSYVGKKMIFRKFFLSTIGGTIISAVVGIWMAYQGYGVWALVTQFLTNRFISTVILAFTIKWKPELKFSWERLGGLFRYGWKLLVGGIINETYVELRKVAIGKLYTSADLAFFDRGMQIPNIIVTNINTSISNVLFPAISNAQNNIADVKAIMRRSIRTSSYIICPMMFGLAVVAEPLVALLLGEKWLPCVPYMQIYCMSYCFEPIQTANLQAIKAVGRSDIFLKLEIIKKAAFTVILFAVMFHSVEAIAYSLLLNTLIAVFVNTTPNKKLISYTLKELLSDMAPGFILSAVMAAAVFGVGLLLPFSDLVKMIIQVATGGVVYLLLSVVLKVESFTYLLNTAKEILMKKKKS